MSEDKKKPQFKVSRTWSIDIDQGVRVEASSPGLDRIVFLSGEGEEDEELFALSYEAFDELHKVITAERARLMQMAADEKKT